MKYAMVASPCIDGEFLVKSPLTALNDGDVKEIPYMLGATSQDMMPFFIFPMAKDFCDKQKTAFCWFFDRKLPGDKNGAGLVEWKQAKAGQDEVIRLGEGEIRMGKVSKAKLLWTTLTNKNVGE